MNGATYAEPREVMAENLEVLREYASGTAPYDVRDRDRRMREFFAIGERYGLTEKDLVTVLFKDILRPKNGCDCPTCRARKAGG